MIWRLRVTASSQFPSKAARRASSPSWRRVSCFCANVSFLPILLPAVASRTHSSGNRNWLTDQEPWARTRHLDVDKLSIQFTIVVEVQQRIASCSPGPPALGSSFHEHFIGLSKSLNVDLGLNPLLQLLQFVVPPVLL